ncbi:MAG: glycosyltransferase family 4 protein [Calditrichia bacterium]
MKGSETSDMSIKVLHILTRLIAAGADENTIYTIQGLDKSEFECDLLIGGESEIAEKVQEQGINVITVKSLVRSVNVIKDTLALIEIIRIILKNEYDIVHTHTAKAGFVGRLAAHIAGTKIIIHSLHGLSFHNFMPKFQRRFFVLLERFVGRYTDLFISVGENIKNKSIEEKIGSAVKYTTIYSGMDLGKFENINFDAIKMKKSLGLHESKFIIGTVARLEPRKGPHYFIDVISHIKRSFPDSKAVIVGTGSFENELKEKVHALNLGEDIIFTGYRKDIAEIMSIFDVVCLTSLWEGIPRVLIQGAKLGKPLVAFDIDGNSEVIKNGINGFLIPPINIQEFADRVMDIIKDSTLRKSMALESLKIIDHRWDKKYMAEEIQRYYLKMCREKDII